MGYLARYLIIIEESNRIKLMDRLNMIHGINISKDRIGGEPSTYLHVLNDENSLKQFLDTLDWIIQEIKSSYIIHK